MLPIFLIAIAIVTDVGYWWANGKKAQIAADACALAAARDLPQTMDRTECTFGTPSRDYVLTNLPPQADPNKGAKHLSTRVLSPYKSETKYVEATVRMRVRTFFGVVVGLNHIDLVRRAVAEKQVGSGDWAIYSHDFFGCDAGEGLEFDNGPGIIINGRVHSNARYHVNSGHPAGRRFLGQAGHARQDQVRREPRPGAGRRGLRGRARAARLPARGLGLRALAVVVHAAAVQLAELQRRELQRPEDQHQDRQGRAEEPDLRRRRPRRQLHGQHPAWNLLRQGRDHDERLRPEGHDHAPLPADQDRRDEPRLHAALRQRPLFQVPNWNGGWSADTNTGNDGTFPTGQPITCTNPDLELILNAGTVKWAGTIFSPCGRVLLNSAAGIGGNPALVGTILGYKVKVNQPDFYMIGKDDFGGNVNIALVE